MDKWVNQQLLDHEDRQAEKIAEAVDRDARVRHNEVYGPRPLGAGEKAMLVVGLIVLVVAIIGISQGLSMKP